jgi:hypothetical protein
MVLYGPWEAHGPLVWALSVVAGVVVGRWWAPVLAAVPLILDIPAPASEDEVPAVALLAVSLAAMIAGGVLVAKLLEARAGRRALP